ncbi:MAG: undecaprenyldiphospho-muramoylpentapeptide beta-N-acetylglucosaminyltransferase [Firmicutes bacterium]|nr:undecaprenyldiphospho-muramoylpentapeptide beta-N-acetylglucosaminyltransferase [Bacillota bacterium]
MILAGGGTGGHIYPAIAIAKGFSKIYDNADILFIGTKDGLESKVIPLEGFTFKHIKVRGFLRELSIKNVIAVKEVLISFFHVYKMIREFKPDVVIGTGGYVSGSVLLTASLMRIPTFIHEQNAYPGITNRILSRFVDRIALTFEEASNYLKNQGQIIVTSNPLRKDITNINCKEGKGTLGFDDKIPLLFIVGGSRGAKSINENIMLLVKECIETKSFQILHMTGDTQYEKVISLYKEMEIPYENKHIKVLPYVYDMPNALAGSDLIISRSGAGLVSEITALGKPCILIPYPYASDNHQEFNAKVLERNGAAIVILESDLNSRLLLFEVKRLLNNPGIMRSMSVRSKELSKINATEEIIEAIEELVRIKKAK